MSFNQIYDTPSHNTPIDPYKDVKFNNVRCNNLESLEIAANNIDVLTINGNPPSSLVPGANGQLLKTTAGVVNWGFFQLGDFSNSLGPASSVLTTNSLATNAEWTSDLSLNNLNVDGDLTINSVAGVDGQVVGINSLGNLDWLPQTIKKSLYYLDISQNINFGITTTLVYNVSYNNLVGQINQTAPSNFTCLVAGVYMIEVDVSCLPSTSENEISIRVGGTPQSYGFLNVVSSFTSARAIVSLNVGNIVQVFSVRTNGDPTPKLNLANTLSSPIVFTRLV